MARDNDIPHSLNDMLELQAGHINDHCIDLEVIGPTSNATYSSINAATVPDALPGQLGVLPMIRRLLLYPAPGSLELRPTAWLDGVRGIAALGVYIFHTMGMWTTIVPAWHSDEDQDSIFQLPAIRTIFASGGAAVCVFFIVSGYVLTYKSLSQLRSNHSHFITPSVLSSMFRRPFRLYLPPIALTFAEMLATRFGIGPPLNFTFVPEPTFLGQLTDWMRETLHFIDPIYTMPRALQGLITHPKYEAVIWTIPLEFYGSLVVYFLLLLLARIDRLGSSYMARTAVFTGIAFGSMCLGSWNIFCFLAGMLIADFDIGREVKGASLTLDTGKERNNSKEKIWWFVFAGAFYVAGFPSLLYEDARSRPMPGFEVLRGVIPLRLHMEDYARLWWSISAVALVTSSSILFPLKRLFTSDIAQYFARISFSLYLIHEFSAVLFGLRLQSLLAQMVGMTPPYNHTVLYWMICLVWYILFSFLVFAIAARVEKWVDAPSVRFAKWLEGWCFGWYWDRR